MEAEVQKPAKRDLGPLPVLTENQRTCPPCTFNGFIESGRVRPPPQLFTD